MEYLTEKQIQRDVSPGFLLYIDKVDQGLKDKRTRVLAGRCVYRTGEIDIMGNKYEI